MKKINYKIISFVIVFTLILSSTLIIVSSEESDLQNKDLKRIIVLDTRDNKISEKYITTNNYNMIFEEYKTENNAKSSIEYIINTLKLLEDNKIISTDKINELQKNILNRKDNNIKNILPLDHDVLNIFNGILFRLEGEKITSLFDMNVFNLPLLNTNITALFSGYSEFQGNGFVISIGFLGIQSIFKYSIITQPHFPEINGAIIGFTGVLIISEGILENNEAKILGIGMDILTYWNEVE